MLTYQLGVLLAKHSDDPQKVQLILDLANNLWSSRGYNSNSALS